MSNKTKTHLVLPKELLRSVDSMVGARKRSLFIAEAAKEKIEREKFLKVLDKTFGSWKDEKHPELTTQEELNKYIRKLRASYVERLKRLYHE